MRGRRGRPTAGQHRQTRPGRLERRIGLLLGVELETPRDDRFRNGRRGRGRIPFVADQLERRREDRLHAQLLVRIAVDKGQLTLRIDQPNHPPHQPEVLILGVARPGAAMQLLADRLATRPAGPQRREHAEQPGVRQTLAVGHRHEPFGERLPGRLAERAHRLQFGKQVPQRQRQLAGQQLLAEDALRILLGIDAQMLRVAGEAKERLGKTPPGAGRRVPWRAPARRRPPRRLQSPAANRRASRGWRRGRCSSGPRRSCAPAISSRRQAAGQPHKIGGRLPARNPSDAVRFCRARCFCQTVQRCSSSPENQALNSSRGAVRCQSVVR